MYKFSIRKYCGKNDTLMTPRQCKIEKMARLFYHAMGTTSIQDLKTMIRMNLIKNNEVTIEDVELAIKHYGSDISTIKVKTTR